jgi:hypothetical protein
MLMIAQLLYSKERALALKGFGFLELLPAMVVRTQQKAITADNAQWTRFSRGQRCRKRERESTPPGKGPTQ